MSLTQPGYFLKRGQNLQVSNIGKSVYSDEKKENFYTVIKPTNFTDYGTIDNFEFLGNKNKLQTLNDGDIVFSAKGTVGKCVLFTKTDGKWITNIHGIILKNKNPNVNLSSFISCILRFYKKWRYFEHFTVGGQGGSLGKKYWDEIVIPIFPKNIQEKIISLYHKNYKKINIHNFDNFLTEDKKWNENVGIIELSDSLKKLKKYIEKILKLISENKNFDFKKIIKYIVSLY